MTECSSAGEARREAQRFEHLVLGRPRQKPAAPASRKGRRRLKAAAELAPDVEAAVALREAWSHKEGTPQTHEAHSRRQPGAIARLWKSGAIDDDQLAWAQQIGTAYEMIGADVTVKTASLEARVDSTRMGDGSFYEALGRVRLEVAYTRWRGAVQLPFAMLEMIAGDVALTEVARRYRLSNRRARQILVEALNLWPKAIGAARKEIDAATLAAAQAGIL